MKKSEPHYAGHRTRLRDRFLKSGIQSMADYEAVELLLTLAVPRKDVKEPAKRLIQKFGKITRVPSIPSKGEIVLYQAPDGKAALDVRLEGETLWLSLNQMAGPFERDNLSSPGT